MGVCFIILTSPGGRRLLGARNPRGSVPLAALATLSSALASLGRLAILVDQLSTHTTELQDNPLYQFDSVCHTSLNICLSRDYTLRLEIIVTHLFDL